MEERTIKCPIEKYLDMNVPLGIVFDTLSVGKERAEKVGSFIEWIVFNNDKEASNIIFTILKANLGESKLKLFISLYLKTYDKKNRKVMRYQAAKDESEIKDLFFIFQTIERLIPVFINVISYYKKRGN